MNSKGRVVALGTKGNLGKQGESRHSLPFKIE